MIKSAHILVEEINIYWEVGHTFQPYSMYYKTWNGLFIFSWKMSGELYNPIVSLLYLYLPHGNIIVQRFIPYVLSLIW